MDRRRAARACAAALLLLVTPFAAFLQYHEYGYWHTEIAVSVLAFAGVALAAGVVAARWPLLEVPLLALLVAVCVDFQFDLRERWVLAAFVAALALLWPIRVHAAHAITLTMATMLGSTLLLPVVAATPNPVALPDSRSDLPLVVHLILDEHIGLDDVPDGPGRAELETEAHAFYRDGGFTLFDGAFSEHRTTVHSLSHLMNLAPGRFSADLYQVGRNGFAWELRQNEYFARVRSMGYVVRVRQSGHLNMCLEAAPDLRCDTYRPSQLAVLQNQSLSTRDRLWVIASVYSKGSKLYNHLEQSYGDVRGWLLPRGVSLPEWTWERSLFSAVSSMAVADQFIRDVSTARRGDYLLAHLLMPHYPYVYDGQCGLLPPDEWLNLDDPEAPVRTKNTPATRADRYARYVQQLRCVYRKMSEIMAAIPQALRRDAVVIMHGDHGSRINQVNPTPSLAAVASKSDFVDAYSTLFAVRSPGFRSGIDSRLAPLTCLLKTLVEEKYGSLDRLDACATRPVVFLVNGQASTVAEPLSDVATKVDQ